MMKMKLKEKRITIAGIGISINTLTQEAKDAIEAADILFGASNILKCFESFNKQSYGYYKAEDIKRVMQETEWTQCVLLVSGDVGFYSAATMYLKDFEEFEIVMIPGVSTVNAFFAKIKRPWQNAVLVSAHGRHLNIVELVRRNKEVFCLTGNNTNKILNKLVSFGFEDIQVFVGQNLGNKEEKIYSDKVKNLADKVYPSLTVLLFLNPNAQDSIRTGISDDMFMRLDKIPMTKSEIRSVVLSKLQLSGSDVCWDIGAGSGSVSNEMALSAFNGEVHAVEQKEEAAELIKANCTAFKVGNVHVIHGKAPQVLDKLPAPDAVLIGGSSGKLEDIILAAYNKNNNAHIVVTAVSIETVYSAIKYFEKFDRSFELIQISASRAKKVASLHMMKAENPIYIITSGRSE